MAPKTTSFGKSNSAAVAMAQQFTCKCMNMFASESHAPSIKSRNTNHWIQSTGRSMASGPQLLFPKLIVFGASEPTGLEVVQQNLAKGHAVTALVRTPESFSIE